MILAEGEEHKENAAKTRDGSTGGHPSYGKHSWTINLISMAVTHEWNAASMLRDGKLMLIHS